MPMSSNNVPRRTVTKAAAWSVPAVGVITAAPAFAASPSLPPYVDGQALTYRVWAKLAGVAPLPSQPVPPYTTPPGTLDLGTCTVVTYVGAALFVRPDYPGSAVPVAVAVEISQEGTDLLRTFGVAELSGGTLVQHFTAVGDVVAPGSRTAELTVAHHGVPEEGLVTLRATGTAAGETPTGDSGSFVRLLGSWTATLATRGSAFIDSVGLAGALEPAGQEVYTGPTSIYSYVND